MSIVASARSHFFLHGFRGVTMDDLAAEMSMSKKTLYVHFQSKQELLNAVVEQKFNDFEMALAEIQKAGRNDFHRTLHPLLSCLRSHAEEVSPTFLRDLSKDNPMLIERIVTRRRELISRAFGAVLRQGQKTAAVRNDISIDLLVELLLAMADSVAAPQSLAARGRPTGKVISAVLSLFLEGALKRKGADHD